MNPSARISLVLCLFASSVAPAQESEPSQAASHIAALCLSDVASDRAAGQALLEHSDRETLLEVNRLLLLRLREGAAPAGQQISVKAAVLILEPTFLEGLGLGLDGSGEDGQTTAILDAAELELLLAAVGENRSASLLASPHLLVLDRHQASITIAEDVSYVSDYEVEVKDGQTIADPVIETLKDGFVLDIHPVLSENGNFVTLDTIWTLSELLRPIQELDTDVGGIRVTIQLPELSVRQMKASVTVPVDEPSAILLASPPDSAGKRHVITLTPEVLRER